MHRKTADRHREGEGKRDEWGVILLFDKATAKLCCVSIFLSLSFSLFVIPSRSSVVVPLHSTASSTCLFTLFPQFLTHQHRSTSQCLYPSFLWIIHSILTLSVTILLFCLFFRFFFSFLFIVIESIREWDKQRPFRWSSLTPSFC